MKNKTLIWLICLFLPSSAFSQSSLIALKPASYALTPQESLVLNGILSAGMVEATWLAETCSIENSVNGQTLDVTLPEESTPITFTIDGIYSEGIDDYYLAGYTSNGSSIQLSQSPAGVIGTIYKSTNNRYWGIQSLSPGTVAVIKYSPNFPPSNDVCGSTESTENSESGGPIQDCLESDNRTIRVLFLFSPAAIASGSIPSMPALAARIIGELNTSSIASGLSPTQINFQSAGAMLLPGFVEVPCSPMTKYLLLSNTTAKSLRESTFADVVCLIIDDVHLSYPPCDASGNAVNNANADDAYCFAEITTTLRQFKATHGIGHVIGLGHQLCFNCPDVRCVTSGGYAHGWNILGTNFRTIMADCVGPIRVARWSADGVPFMGSPTGNPYSDNARVLKERAHRIACFRPDPPPQPGPISINGNPTICDEETGTYTVVGAGTLSQASWKMKTDMSPWQNVGTGSLVSITAPIGAKVITLFVSVPGTGFVTKSIEVVKCFQGVDERDFSHLPDANSSILVFPNPTENFIKIHGVSPADKIEIFDIHGKRLILRDGAPELTLDLHNVSSGTYFLSVNRNGIFQHFKIIKK